MEKQKKRAKKKSNAKKPGRPRVFKLTGRTMPGKSKPADMPKPIAAPAQDMHARVQQACHNCIFCVSSAFLWMRTLLSGFPITGMCANHPDTPGQMRPIPHRPCRNCKMKPFRVDPPEPPNDGIRYIPLTRGLHAMVDAADYEWLSKYKWYAGRPTRAGKIYARRNIPGGTVLMHRMIMQPPEGMVVDHINGNTLDNRRCNLRVCTQTENIQNSRPRHNATSRFRGVYRRGNKWEVKIRHKGKTYRLPPFDDEIEAAKARDRLARQLYGKHAWQNIPPGDPQDEGNAGVGNQ